MVESSSPKLKQARRLHRAGQLERAARGFQQVLRENPRQSDAWHGLAMIAWQEGNHAKAVEQLQAAIAIRSDIAVYHYDLGNFWRKAGRKTEAVMAYLRAADLDRDYFDALFNLGTVLCELVRPAEGVQALRLAIALRPDHPGAHLTLGMCLERLGHIDHAVEQYLATLRLRKDDPQAFLLLGGALFKTGHIAEADLAFARSLALAPNQSAAHSRRLAVLNYRADLTARQMAQAHLDWGDRHAAPFWPSIRKSGEPLYLSAPEPSRRLRIGYVSPNFFRHSVAHFLLPVLRAQDRERFEVFCYSNSVITDDTTSVLRAECAKWREIRGQSDEQVAALVRADRIDILVDLAGHTGDALPLVFARRPAPVQVAWLGYPQTTGMKAIDYRLSDAIVEPPGEADALSAETIVRLPHGFHCFGRPGEDSSGDGCDRAELPVEPPPCLANGFITFGSFNTVQKMSAPLVTLWARVMQAVPGSRLVLKSLPDVVIADRYHALFAAEGIDPARIEFLHWKAARPDHLRLYARMDIALDTFPYHGTTTTCEALWMGVPVLSLCGDGPVSRVGASLLTRVGLEDWIATSGDGYVEQAVQRAADVLALTRLRAGLRDRMRASALCDAPGLTRELEVAFRTAWQAWCYAEARAGQKSQVFTKGEFGPSDVKKYAVNQTCAERR